MKQNYLKKLLIIAVPLMLSDAISQLQMIIDRIFLGRMDDLYMSALGNVTSPMWTTMSCCYSLAMGASILISQNVGADNRKNVETYASSLIKWNSLLPILLFLFWTFFARQLFEIMGVSENVMPYCLTYTRYYTPVFLILGLECAFTNILQTSNYTKPMVYFGIIRAGTNILLDWILIFGHFGFPRLGIKGAAIATTIAEYVGFLFTLAVVLKTQHLDTMPPFRSILSAPFRPFFESVKLGTNAALEDFGWNFGNLVLIRILNTIDEKAAGIYAIVFSVEVLVVVMIGAIGRGTMTLSGEAKGSGDLKQYKSICKIAYLLSAGIAVVTLIVCALFPQQILGMFTKDTAIITGCGIYLLLVCLNLFGKSGNIIIGNSIRGSGNTIWMLGTQLFGTVLVIAVAAFLVYGIHLGIIGVFISVIVDEGTRALINLWKLRRIMRDWNKLPQTA